MRLGLSAVLFFTLGSSTGSSAPPQDFNPPAPAPDRTAQDQAAAGKPTVTVPAGTKVAVALTSPVWSKTVKSGDNVYAVSVFPVAIDQNMAIPPGTYVAGSIDTVKRPTWTSNRAEFQMHFTKLIFGNGYTVDLAAIPNG